MIQAGVGISTALDPREAAREAVSQALARRGGRDREPGIAFLVVSAAHGRAIAEVVAEARDALAPSVVVGGSVEGIVAPGVEVSDWPAVLVLALAGVEACSFLLHDLGLDGTLLGEEVADRVGGPLQASDIVMLLPDGQGLDARTLVSAARSLRPATVLGAGAAPAARGSTHLWQAGEVAATGVAGFVLRGARTRVAIAQAGRPVTPPMKVTRARGNWLLGLDGRPALQVYTETAARRGAGGWGETSPPLLVGLLPPGGEDTRTLVVRNVVGFDRDRQAFSVPEPMASGQRLTLVELDATAARDDLARRLGELRQAPRPAFGLYLNCRARGAALFGKAGVEAEQLANAFADLPIAGLIGPFQLAPLTAGGDPVLLGYAGALALVDG